MGIPKPEKLRINSAFFPIRLLLPGKKHKPPAFNEKGKKKLVESQKHPVTAGQEFSEFRKI